MKNIVKTFLFCLVFASVTNVSCISPFHEPELVMEERNVICGIDEYGNIYASLLCSLPVPSNYSLVSFLKGEDSDWFNVYSDYYRGEDLFLIRIHGYGLHGSMTGSFDVIYKEQRITVNVEAVLK